MFRFFSIWGKSTLRLRVIVPFLVLWRSESLTELKFYSTETYVITVRGFYLRLTFFNPYDWLKDSRRGQRVLPYLPTLFKLQMMEERVKNTFTLERVSCILLSYLIWWSFRLILFWKESGGLFSLFVFRSKVYSKCLWKKFSYRCPKDLSSEY